MLFRWASFLNYSKFTKMSILYSYRTHSPALKVNPVITIICQPAITCSKLTTETLEKGVKYVQR